MEGGRSWESGVEGVGPPQLHTSTMKLFWLIFLYIPLLRVHVLSVIFDKVMIIFQEYCAIYLVCHEWSSRS